jgi:plasmid stabilization system protein ParE
VVDRRRRTEILAAVDIATLRSIWNYIVKEGGNLAAADGVFDAITERFYLLSQYPRIGRSRDDLPTAPEIDSLGDSQITESLTRCWLLREERHPWGQRLGSRGLI